MCPWQLLRCLSLGLSPLKACSPPCHMWSAGILLAEMATGELPFPGDEGLLGEDEMDAEQCKAFTTSVHKQAQSTAWVSALRPKQASLASQEMCVRHT